MFIRMSDPCLLPCPLSLLDFPVCFLACHSCLYPVPF